MVDKDVMLTKVDAIQRCLERIHDTVAGDYSRLHDDDVHDIVILNLQRAIQLVIDIASHVVATEKMGIPRNMRETFTLLEHHHIIDHDLAEKLGKMVGFRNIVVHDYQIIDKNVLQAILEHHLVDLEQFYKKIISHIYLICCQK